MAWTIKEEIYKYDDKFSNRLKRRVVDARTQKELRFILDGILVAGHFNNNKGNK